MTLLHQQLVCVSFHPLHVGCGPRALLTTTSFKTCTEYKIIGYFIVLTAIIPECFAHSKEITCIIPWPFMGLLSVQVAEEIVDNVSANF